MNEGGESSPTVPARRLSERLKAAMGGRPGGGGSKNKEVREREGGLLPPAYDRALRRLAWLAALAAVFAAAIIWRLHYASQTRIYTYDSYFYLVLGRNLRHGLDYVFTAGHPHFKFLPLYPMSIAFLGLFSHNVEFAGKLLNVLFTSACVFPIYVIGALLFHRRVGLAAAALFAFEPISTIWASVPMSEGLFTLIVCLGVCFMVCWIKKEKSCWIYLAAAAAGLAVVTRWEGFFFVAFLGVFGIYYCIRRRIKLTQLALAGAIALAPFAMLMARNWVVFGTPIKSAYLSEYSSHAPELEVLKPGARIYRYLLFGGTDPLGAYRHLYNYGYLAFGYAGLALGLFIRRFRAGIVLIIAWLVFMGPTHFIWYYVAARFLFAAVPALCLGAGFLLGFPWVSDGRERNRRAALVFAYALAICIIAALVFTSVPIIDDSFRRDIAFLEDDDGGLAAKEAMFWLKENAGDAAVASRDGPKAAFYLGRDVLFLGDWVFEPADIRLDHVIEDCREKGVRYLVLSAASPDPAYVMTWYGLDPELLSTLRLAKVFSAPPGVEGNTEVHSFIFEVPGAGGAPP